MRSDLSPSRSATSELLGAAGALPPRGIGDTRAAQGGPGAGQAGSPQVAQVAARARSRANGPMVVRKFIPDCLDGLKRAARPAWAPPNVDHLTEK